MQHACHSTRIKDAAGHQKPKHIIIEAVKLESFFCSWIIQLVVGFEEEGAHVLLCTCRDEESVTHAAPQVAQSDRRKRLADEFSNNAIFRNNQGFVDNPAFYVQHLLN